MPIFRYEALDDTGQSCTGEVEAEDVTRATVELTSRSLVVISIELVVPADSPPPRQAYEAVEDSGRSYDQRIDDVLRQPDEVIRILQALAAEPASSGLRKQLNYLIDRLGGGLDAKQFLSDERLCNWLPIVMSSRRAASLETNYAQLLTQILDERTRRRGLMFTFSYPLMMLSFALLVLIPICIFIVPTFQKMFAEFGLRLPPPTMFIFSLSDLVNHRPHYLILGLATLSAAVAWAGYAWVSRAMTTRLLGWLIAGNSVSLIAMSRLTSMLAELIELGAPVSESLLLAGRASRHAYFREAAQRLAVHLAEPNFTWHASPVAHSFPLALLHALSAGPDQRPSAPLIRELSHMYSHRVSLRMNQGPGFTSPLLVMVVGMIVGLIVIALFMPLVQMVTSLT